MSNLYNLPSGWELKRLDEVSTFYNGRAYKKKELLEEGKYRVLRVGNFFTNNSWYYSDLELDENKYCDNGDLLYAWSASFGPKIWDEEKVIYHYHIWKVVPKNDLIIKDYLYQYLNWDTEKIKSDKGSGTTMVHITKGSMEERQIPLPPLLEQQRIVSKLNLLFEKIDKSIELHQKNMDEADVFMGSVLNEVFEELENKSRIHKIDDIYDLKTGGTPSTKNKDYWDNGHIKWLSSSDINQIQIYDCEKRITQLGFDNSNTKIIEKNSVLIALNGQGKTRGSVAMLRTEATLNQSLVAMVPKDRNKNLSDFLYRNLQMRYIEIRELTGLNDRRGLNMTLIRNIEVPIPSLSIQQKVVNYLDEISEKVEKVKLIQKEKMKSLQDLKSSILDQAFRGEL